MKDWKYRIKLHFRDANWNEGKRLYENRKAMIKSMDYRYIDESSELEYEVVGCVIDSGELYQVQFTENEGRLYHFDCQCSEFESSKKDYWSLPNGCKHIASLVMETKNYLEQFPIGIHTNKEVSQLIDRYIGESIVEMSIPQTEQKVELEPRIVYDGRNYRLNFRIGHKKKYVLKDVYEFADHMAKGEEVEYGAGLSFVHHRNAFSNQSIKLIDFLCDRTKENLIMFEQFRTNYYAKIPDRRNIMITPNVMDLLFPMIQEQKIEFTDQSYNKNERKPKILSCQIQNPQINVTLVGRTNKNNEFYGADVVFENFLTIEGEHHLYIIKNGILYQTDQKFQRTMTKIVQEVCKTESMSFFVGSERIGQFYQHILRKIEPYVVIHEEDMSQLKEMLPVDPQFQFYLDLAEDRIITCKLKVSYEYESFTFSPSDIQHSYQRDAIKEYQVYSIVKKHFPKFNEASYVFESNDQEDKIYDIISYGIPELMAYGEVNVAKELQMVKIRPQPKISMGVTISNGLLNLDLVSSELDLSELKDIFKSYHLKKKYHRLRSGEILQLENSSLAELVEFTETCHIDQKQMSSGHIELPMHRSIYLDHMLHEMESISFRRDSQFKSLVRNFKSIQDSDYSIPENLISVLREYQKYGYRFLRTVEEYGFGGILADDMGLGKTLQVITFIYQAKLENKSGTSLVICPASLVYNWEKEFQRFAPDVKISTVVGSSTERKKKIEGYKQYDVIITSYDLLKRDIVLYQEQMYLYQIIDEAQYIKNHSTQGAKAVKLIKAKTRFALTGTPIENRLSELWSIFDYIMPDFLYSYEHFKKTFEMPITKYKDDIITKQLSKLVQPFILRRMKEQVLKDLPNKIEEVTYVKMEGEQQKLYDSYVLKVKETLLKQTGEEYNKNKLKLLADLTRLRQICCDPTLCYEDFNGTSAKLETCLELIESARLAGHKILLFSQFTSMLSIISDKLMINSIPFYQITGGTSKEERMRLVERFNKDSTPVFLISLKAGGTGLNLTGADIVIHFDPWWNVAAQNQATDRAHRIGQKQVVTVYKLITQGTIEEKILQMQENKKELADQIIHGEMTQLNNMTKDELLAIL